MLKATLTTLLLALSCTIQAQAQSQPASIESLSGQWAGELNVNGAVLPLVFWLEPDGTGSVDSPAQGAMGIPIQKFSVNENAGEIAVEIDVSAIGGRYIGTVDATGTTLQGHWMQGGAKLAMTLARSEAEEAAAQEAASDLSATGGSVQTLPYRTEDVYFASLDDPQVTLAGTLTLPDATDQRAPAVLLISGSGPQDRDSALFGHQPFQHLADRLTRQGHAVLRFDDRGIGESTGNFALATTFDFADDAAGAVRYLRRRVEIDPQRIVIVGHSEGGVVAQLCANRDPAIAGVVQIASPVLPYSEFVIDQVRDLSIAANDPPAVTAQKVQAQKQVIAAALDAGAEPDAIRKAVVEQLLQLGVPEEMAQRQGAAFGSPWLSAFLALDPREALLDSTVPVLMIWGSKDIQVNAERNLEALDSLEPGADVQALILEGHNHLMQQASSGLISEYASAGTPMSDELIGAITLWLDNTP